MTGGFYPGKVLCLVLLGNDAKFTLNRTDDGLAQGTGNGQHAACSMHIRTMGAFAEDLD